MKIVGVDIVGVVEETGQVIVSITLEDSDGYRDSFMIDAWELLDTQEVAKILYRWKTTILPQIGRAHV